ncbi:MAG TPA: Flp pilus assembly protein CpaB [Jiangellaceae bacterium]|nr:Flp pilus assembly protein CpaB [Jiangellaceae bacterium]
MDDRRLRLSRFARTVTWHRRLLASGLAAAAVALAIEAASPPAPETVEVVVAADDLSGGTTLTPDQLTVTELPPALLPAGLLAADDAVGRVLAGPLRAGEPITDLRVVGPSLLEGWGSGVVASPVRIADAGAAAFLRPGDRIDLLAAAADGLGDAQVVAAEVPVLAVTDQPDAVLAEGALLLVGATAEQAAALARAAVTARLTFTLGAR